MVSAGTERMLVEFGKANWIDKARQQPDKVRMVLDKVRMVLDKVRMVLDKVRMVLDKVRMVLEAGAGVSGFAPGDGGDRCHAGR